MIKYRLYSLYGHATARRPLAAPRHLKRGDQAGVLAFYASCEFPAQFGRLPSKLLYALPAPDTATNYTIRYFHRGSGYFWGQIAGGGFSCLGRASAEAITRLLRPAQLIYFRREFRAKIRHELFPLSLRVECRGRRLTIPSGPITTGYRATPDDKCARRRLRQLHYYRSFRHLFHFARVTIGD